MGRLLCLAAPVKTTKAGVLGSERPPDEDGADAGLSVETTWRTSVLLWPGGASHVSVGPLPSRLWSLGYTAMSDRSERDVGTGPLGHPGAGRRIPAGRPAGPADPSTDAGQR